MPPAHSAFQPFVKENIWLCEYPIRYYGIHCNARTTLIRLPTGGLIAHSPCPLSDEAISFVASHGPLAFILAPGTFHHLYALEWARHFTEAQLYVHPGLPGKVPALRGYPTIKDGAGYPWSPALQHVNTAGSRFINETVFFHAASKTLIVTDLIEHFTEHSTYNWVLALWFKLVFRMWNNPKPAPEYQLGWRDKAQARQAVERMLAWDFDRIVLAHGDVVPTGGKELARRAWAALLR